MPHAPAEIGQNTRSSAAADAAPPPRRRTEIPPPPIAASHGPAPALSARPNHEPHPTYASQPHRYPPATKRVPPEKSTGCQDTRGRSPHRRPRLSRRNWIASAAVRMLPLPITGMPTACFTRDTTDQSASPTYPRATLRAMNAHHRRAGCLGLLRRLDRRLMFVVRAAADLDAYGNRHGPRHRRNDPPDARRIGQHCAPLRPDRPTSAPGTQN